MPLVTKHFFGLVSLLVVLASCSDNDGPERRVVNGRVTFQGEPVENGNVRFRPIEGTPGQMCGGPIHEGEYSTKASGGVTVGTHRVEILAYHFKAPPGVDVESLDPDEIIRHAYIPPRYNVQSEIKYTVESGRGPITKDFDLE